MALPGVVRQALEEMREGLEEIATEVEVVQVTAQTDKEEMADMVLNLRDELKKEIMTIGKAISMLANTVSQNASTGSSRPKRELINVKGSIPETFHGKSDENFKKWSQKVKAYTNAIQPGFRKVLQWAEAAGENLDDAALKMITWTPLPSANGQLYDLLITITEGDAQGMVLSSPDGNGLEAFRKLTAWYDSYGKVNELDRFNRLLQVYRARNIQDVPRAVES